MNNQPESGRKNLPALLMVLALFAVAAVFFGHLLRLSMLPSFYMTALGLLLMILILTVALLTGNRKRKVCIILGILLTLLVSGGCVFGTVYTSKAIDTLQKIIRSKPEQTISLGVYVRADDPAASLEEIKSVPLGRLTTVDRDETDSVLRRIGEVWQENPASLRYNSPTEMIYDILEGRVRAIIISRNLLDAMDTNLDRFSAEDLRELAVFAEAKAQDPETPAAPEKTPDSGLKPFLLYISGIDDRKGLAAHSLTDVNILVAVNPLTHQILMVNTPRDYYVQTPVSGEARDKLTHAGLYGVETSIRTLESLYNLEIDSYFRVDFSGFKAIIDALGGVDVYCDQEFSVENYTFVKGINHMTGYQALLFSRHRHTLEGGDRARGIHQMEVIKAVLKKAASGELLHSFFPLMDAMSGSFETTIPYGTLAELVQRQLSGGGEWSVNAFSVNGANALGTTFTFPGEHYVMIPDEELVALARQLLLDVLAGNEPRLPE